MLTAPPTPRSRPPGEYKIPGTFMVIQGTAVSVEIKQETTYVAVSTGSNGR